MADENNILRKPLTVAVPDDIDSFSSLIHDQFFELPEVEFDWCERTVTIPYRRLYRQGPEHVIKKGLLSRLIEVPVIRAQIIVRGVTDYRADDRERIETYFLCDVSYNRPELVFKCEPNLTLHMKVEKLGIEHRDLELRGRAHIRVGFWGDAFNGTVLE
jgi:hypothetical protein